MNEDNAIELNNVCKQFKYHTRKGKNNTKTALTDITLEIKKGEVFGIVGRNGSGKSTLLNIIADIMNPSSGTVERSGKVASILELGMGFNNDLTGRENIYIKAALYGLSKKEINSRIEDLIRFTELGEGIDDPVRTYSSGMKGRLAFAVMMWVDAEIMLVDEVFSTGDSAFSSKARLHLKRITESDRTVIIVSHGLNHIREMCSRAAWIDNGVLKIVGSAKKVCGMYEEAMEEDPEIVMSLAEAGEPSAINKLGCWYRDGEHFDKNPERALDYFQHAAMLGNIEAQLNAGDMLFAGREVDRNLESAREIYRRSAEKNNVDAMIKTSRCIVKADKTEQEILSFFEKLSKTGNPRHMYEYADVKLKMAITTQDRDEAYEIMSVASEMGSPDATYALAKMTLKGMGTKKSVKKAIALMTKAADYGIVGAQEYLSNLYYDGIKVDCDFEQAYRWGLEAAQRGSVTGMYRVATMLSEGCGVDKNQEEAYVWYSKVANCALRDSALTASKYALCNDPRESFAYCKYSAYANDQKSMKKMANMILFGIGTPQDVQNALDTYATLSDNGDEASADAILSFGRGLSQQLPEHVCCATRCLTNARNVGSASAKKITANHNCILSENESPLSYAAQLYRELADEGSTDALMKLAEMEKNGIGIEQNIQSAIEHYTSAMDAGELKAAVSLLKMHAYGNVVSNTVYNSTIACLESFAIGGNVKAMRILGDGYYFGKTLEKNLEKAFYWHTVASNAGDSRSDMRLASMLIKGEGCDIDEKRAFHIYEKLSSRGDPSAMYAILTLDDKTRPIDTSSYINKLMQLSDAGDIQAKKYLDMLQ